MRLPDVTGLGRLFDPKRYPSHRTIGLIALGAALVSFGIDSGDPWRAVLTGGTAFATWALVREIDPDRPQSAPIAATSAVAFALFAGTPTVGPVFIAMVAARIVSRSTGLPPRWTDLALNGALAILFAGTPAGWAVGIMVAFAMVRDATLPGDPPPAAAVFAGATAVGVTARVALAGTLGTWVAPSGIELAVVVAGLLGWIALIRRTEPILSVGDWTKEILDQRRVREARIFGVAPAAIAIAAAGSAGAVALAPLWISAAVVAIVRRGLRGAAT